MRSNCNLNRLIKKRNAEIGIPKNRFVSKTAASETLAGKCFLGGTGRVFNSTFQSFG